MNKFEHNFVYNTYNTIADHFSETRSYVWPNIKKYIDNIEIGSNIADIGCGNGKNMYREDCNMIGVDFCEKFVEICKNKNKNVIVGNCVNIPLKSNTYDYTLCIAVLHHLSDNLRRIQCLDELIRITKIKGKLLVQVWDYEGNTHRSPNKDAMIKWNLQKKYADTKQNIEINRFYHLFSENELIDMVKDKNVKILNYYNSHNNWVIELEKI
jgi:ubiquinone/menaquinone biosynthesis C-methylase UbiE